jgi:hypothetical protein
VERDRTERIVSVAQSSILTESLDTGNRDILLLLLLLLYCHFFVKTYSKTNELSYFKYACGDYALLYNILSSYDWSSVYSKSSVEVAVASLNSAVHEAIDTRDLFSEDLLKDLNFPLDFPALCALYFGKELLLQTF